MLPRDYSYYDWEPQIGDVVVGIKAEDGLDDMVGATGVICGFDDERYAVEWQFPEPNGICHSCAGKTRSKYGWWCSKRNIQPVPSVLLSDDDLETALNDMFS